MVITVPDEVFQNNLDVVFVTVWFSALIKVNYEFAPYRQCKGEGHLQASTQPSELRR